MRRRVPSVLALWLVANLVSPPIPIVSAGPVDPVARSVIQGRFVVRWSQANPEAITYLSWNGSPSLTNTWAHPNCPTADPSEFFGNAWGGDGDVDFVAPVGWGSAGRWSPRGASAVGIESAASGCPGTSGITVRTTYSFHEDATIGRIQVERRFLFGATPFASDVRPYIPRLYPTSAFNKLYFPNAAGTTLVSRGSFDCGLGCHVNDWQGTWFAIHDPVAGRGLIVRHVAGPSPAELWIDDDGGSATTASAVGLRQSGAGFTGLVVDRQVLCFYDATTGWVPSLEPPVGCLAAWVEPPLVAGSKVGLPSAAGPYTPETKVTSIGRYVTWQADLGAAAAGRTVGVMVATRSAGGSWSGFTRLTSRTADALGVVTFSRRETQARWLSIRFEIDGTLTSAAQARWR